MPAKMTLQALQNAIESKDVDVRSNLSVYAVGILIEEQHQSLKNTINAYEKLKSQQASFPQSSQAYTETLHQLTALEDQRDLGFYYTIALFHQLAVSHPVESKHMIESVLRFDTMGRYLLEEHPIFIDGKPFVLENILKQQGIDVLWYKEVARNNQIITLSPYHDLPVILSVEKKPIAFSLPEHLEQLEETDKLEAIQLYRKALAVSEMEVLRKTIDQFHFDFSLVTVSPTKENVSTFIQYLVELFAHAKMQDSSALYLLTTSIPEDFKHMPQSLVALLGNTLPYWFFIALVQSPNVEIFSQRIEFIMTVFAELNRATPHLPIHANADIYLPFMVLSSVFQHSILQYHPAMKSHWHQMQAMDHLHNALSINDYMKKHMHFFVGGNTAELPSMRMFMMAQLELEKEMSYLLSKSQSPELCKIKDTIKNGQFVYDYFYPPLLGSSVPLGSVSESVRTIFNALLQLQLLISKKNLNAETKDLLLSAFPLYKSTDNFDEKLQVLESVLLAEFPRVFFYEKHFFRQVLVCLKDSDAFDFVELKVNKILEQVKKLDASLSKTEIEKWCLAILEKKAQQSLRKSVPASTVFPIVIPPSTPQTPKRESMGPEKSLPNFGLFKQAVPSTSQEVNPKIMGIST